MKKLNPVYWLYKFEKIRGTAVSATMLCILTALVFVCLVIITK